MAKSTATLTDNETGKTYEMPIIHGTIGPRLVDVRKFYGDSGMFTYDPGFTSMVTKASCCTVATTSPNSPSRATSWRSPIC